MTAGVNTPTSEVHPADESRKKMLGLPFDVILLVVVAALLIFGLMMVYSTTFDLSYLLYKDLTFMFVHQLGNAGLGLVVMAAAMCFPHRWLRWRWLSIGVIGATIVLLGWVLVVPSETGVRRALSNSSMQPSELAKLALIFYLATWLSSKGDRIQTPAYGLIPFGVIVGCVAGLVWVEPDTSAALTIAIVAVIMFFVAGADFFQMALVFIIGTPIGFVLINTLGPGRERFAAFFSGFKDLTQASPHIQQAVAAFVNGGWLGRGLGNSSQKFLALPTPHTDSVFAIIGEELGLVGCLVVIALFALLVWRGFRITAQARDPQGALLAAGITTWIALEALINIAVMVQVLPVAGNALPFISYGGSSLVTVLAGVGLLLNVSRQGQEETVLRKTRATFNLRRRDGRRRLSRVVRR